jgi:hypothetical protein
VAIVTHSQVIGALGMLRRIADFADHGK